jgi:hypothetical protein
MKLSIPFFLLLAVIAGCRNDSEETQLSYTTDFNNSIIKSYDTIIVIPYNDNGGTYFPARGADSLAFDVNRDGENDFSIIVSHDQHTMNSPHDWQVDHSVMIRSERGNSSIAVDPEEPISIREFVSGERIDDTYTYQNEACIFNFDSYSQHAADILHTGDLILGLKVSQNTAHPHFGYLKLSFAGNYVILKESVFEMNRSYCNVNN